MKLSYNWLKEYLKCDLTVQQIAEGAMAEHFDANLLAHRAADILLLYLLMDMLHLVHI